MVLVFLVFVFAALCRQDWLCAVSALAMILLAWGGLEPVTAHTIDRTLTRIDWTGIGGRREDSQR